jgi:hypothetical protein
MSSVSSTFKVLFEMARNRVVAEYQLYAGCIRSIASISLTDTEPITMNLAVAAAISSLISLFVV